MNRSRRGLALLTALFIVTLLYMTVVAMVTPELNIFR